VYSTAGTPPSGSGNNGNGGNGNGADKESKQYQTAGSRFTIYKVNKASRKKREKSSAKKERKATKTLAIVLGKSFIPSHFKSQIYYIKFKHASRAIDGIEDEEGTCAAYRLYI
jgi:hypothetical protein